ncbi:VOC family protein [Aeromicrobium endophyticum]|uniref:Putative pterin-4-alpha-carbinolamine dehydratase n=1 Tax=Aeromicrobium endophyticum TaxID=2292704 RepID=A0A371P2F0_9ACTN|nr:VOC family protein [Aeromicrobium endophyticum]REK69720.1 4a-hydroxytetrahydrobiopterin dehydratase [Aeromicrobium endophyticum]
MADDVLSGDQIVPMGLDDWRSMYGTLEARFATGDFATGLRLVVAIGAAAEEAGHHPEVELRAEHVAVVLTSHDAGGKTLRDVDLARRISAAAADLGVVADPTLVQRPELALDTWDIEAIRPFWAAVLQAEARGDDEVVDPLHRTPTIWFQRCEPHDEPHQRWHLDLRVPPEVVHDRIAAAVAAGGVVVSDQAAPRFWVLADPQGNKICLCTHVTRPD